MQLKKENEKELDVLGDRGGGGSGGEQRYGCASACTNAVKWVSGVSTTISAAFLATVARHRIPLLLCPKIIHNRHTDIHLTPFHVHVFKNGQNIIHSPPIFPFPPARKYVSVQAPRRAIVPYPYSFLRNPKIFEPIVFHSHNFELNFWADFNEEV